MNRAVCLLTLAAACGRDEKPASEEPEDELPTDTDDTDDTDPVEDSAPEPEPESCAPAALRPVSAELCPSPWAAERLVQAGEPDPSNELSRAPGIGRLDRDGDGVLTEDDGTSVVMATSRDLRAYDAAGGEPWLRILPSGAGLWWQTDVSLVADLDGDGLTEVLLAWYEAGVTGAPVLDAWFHFEAHRADGTLLWASPPLPTAAYSAGELGPSVTAADLDGDGGLEVVADRWILDGVTGALRATFDLPEVTFGGGPLDFGIPQSVPVVADLDLDGQAEIVHAAGVYAADGSRIWATGLFEPELLVDGRTEAAVLEIDGDPEAELAFVTSDVLRFYQHDGAPIGGPFPMPGEYVAPPCVADFDGDGTSEIVTVTGERLALFELDGTKQWEVEQNNASACTAFDFDADGQWEIVLAGFVSGPQGTTILVRVMDGRYGRERIAIPLASGTWVFGGQPIVADVNDDGTAELVVTWSKLSNDGDRYAMGFEVYGPASGGWADAGAAWGLSDFTEGRLDDLGQVSLPAFWQDGLYHARTPLSVPVSTLQAPQLRAEILDVCALSCGVDEPQTVSVQVSNTGSATAPAGAVLSLVSTRPNEDVVLATVDVPALEPLAAVILPFEVRVNTLPARIGVRIDAPFDQCDPTPEAFDIPDAVCP